VKFRGEFGYLNKAQYWTPREQLKEAAPRSVGRLRPRLKFFKILYHIECLIYIYEALNVDKKIITQFVRKPRDESFEPN
jgi:hypothetical protein